MKKAVWSGVIAVAGVLFLSGTAYAQATDNKTINVQVNVNARAKLTLGTATVSFTDQDPDTVPTLTSSAVAVSVKARTTATGAVNLTVLAGGDFANSAGDLIPLNTLTWAATGTSFVGGFADKTTAQSVGSWTGSGQQDGTNTFSLPNSWSYAVGTYAVALNYTLSAP